MSIAKGSHEKTMRGRAKKKTALTIALERIAECRVLLGELLADGTLAEVPVRQRRKQRRT